jgi:glucosamine-6-phosphate deaminase
LAHLVIVMMDEYVVPSGDGFRNCPAHLHYSCRRFAEREIQGRLNHAILFRARISGSQRLVGRPGRSGGVRRALGGGRWRRSVPVGERCFGWSRRLQSPGNGDRQRSRILRLAETTRRDNLATFPAFEALEAVPTHGVSVGLDTIARLSAAVVMVLNGAHKQAAPGRESFHCSVETGAARRPYRRAVLASRLLLLTDQLY